MQAQVVYERLAGERGGESFRFIVKIPLWDHFGKPEDFSAPSLAWLLTN
jgi:hypothetical protein